MTSERIAAALVAAPRTAPRGASRGRRAPVAAAAVLRWRQVESPIGPVFIAATDAGVAGIGLDTPAERALVGLEGTVAGGGWADRAAEQVMEYFAGHRESLDLPLDLGDRTAFERAVLKVVRSIPAGRTMTYGEVADAAGYPRAARAVGNVMRRNRVLLGVPCHRVVAAAGLGGYGGRSDLKRWLLAHESGGAIGEVRPSARA